ncbi:MAG TPA: GH25 family lysozyme, partial [Candidatus Paceibacterota bacterium]
DSVSAQVSYFKSRDKVKPGYVIAVDWESLNGAWSSCADKDAFIKALKAAYPKNRVGLYTNLDGWKHHDTTSYCGDFLWIADVDTVRGRIPSNGDSPDIQHPWTFWQYGQQNGIDANVGNFSTQTALKAWAGYPVVSQPSVVVPQAYRDVMLSDVFPLPVGHTDADGNNAWSLQTTLEAIFPMIEETHSLVKEIHDRLSPTAVTENPSAK